jgi:MFS transporter, putative metabolite:H+ symporter
MTDVATAILSPSRKRRHTAVSFEHPVAFWISVLTVAIGVVLQLPMFFMARHDHYHLVGMMIPPEMYLGMAMIILGSVLAVYALFPRHRDIGRVSQIKVRALDAAPIRRSHVLLLLVLAAAVTIDVMKPVSLAFVAPGAAIEYGLKGPLNPHANALPVALYPLAGITGTTIGSFIWGWLGDRIGRRAAILIAGMIFIGTSTCGAMPAYWLNLVTCFMMGIGVGGMLPIAFALMSETIPARHRGWVMVLVGGDIAGAYIITSWISSTLGAPDRFGWRILWLIGLPTGLVLILLNRWIPESPRFLLQQGRDEEAAIIMARYGAEIVPAESELEIESTVKNNYRQLFSGPFLGFGAAVLLLALSIGLTQYGFQQWMPSNLQKLGFSAVTASKMLRDAALMGLPLTVPVALLYGFWSSKKTIILLASLTGASLAVFTVAGDRIADNQTFLQVVLVIPIWGISILNSVLSAYAVEIYPTRIRSRGSGMSAGATKFGGVLILLLAAAAVAAPSVAFTALFALIPMVLAVAAIMIFGPETKRKSLEVITAEELHKPALALDSV